MDTNDQQAIEGLFDRLAEVERQSPPRDIEAEKYIHDQLARQPGAPYYMAQTIVIQEQALRAAQARMEELEQDASSRRPSGGLFSGIFGDSRQSSRASGSVPRVGRPQMGGPQQPFGQPPQRAGGGFLAGAAQTAMGVAGGVLLGNMIAGMLGGDEAQASEQEADNAQAQEAGYDDTGFDDGGFDDTEI
jgi:hypothetical protein